MLKFGIDLEVGPETEADIFSEFEQEEYFEPPHILDKRGRGIVAQAILDNDAVILNQNGEIIDEEKPFFSQPIPPFIYEEMIDGISIHGDVLFDGERSEIALGFNNLSDGFNTTWQWTYPRPDDASYPDMSAIDLYSPTFHKAISIQEMILASIYKNEDIPFEWMSNMLGVSEEEIDIAIKSGTWTADDYASIVTSKNPKPGILKLLLTPAIIPRESFHGRYNKIYSTAKVRTAFTSAIPSISQEISYLDRYTAEFINWERSAKKANNIFRTRYALLCQDAYLIKFLELAKQHAIRS